MDFFWKEAERWLRQAEYDLKAAEWCQQGGFFAPATFWAQQSAAKSLRAFLFLNKEDTRETRSVVDLLDRALVYEEGFKEFVSSSRRLDIYYKTSRFPGLPGGIGRGGLNKDAVEAIRRPADILEVIEKEEGYLRALAFAPAYAGEPDHSAGLE
jgi:HEPN domain-containing protein